jgi:hypothetical protein
LPILQPELVATAPDAASVFSPFTFSPDKQSLYFFKNVLTQGHLGDLYQISFAPTPGRARLIGTRASLYDLNFIADRLVYLRGLDGTGDTGQLVSSSYDGSGLYPMAEGAATSEILVAYPPPQHPPDPGHAPYYGPKDLGVEVIPPVFANLVGAARDPNATVKPIDGSRPIVGSLAFGQSMTSREMAVSAQVQSGAFTFSDDGFVLVYVGGATYDAKIRQYAGKLGLFQTRDEVAPVVPSLEGASQLGPVVDRSLFVNAPKAPTPGIYFVKY